MFEFRHVVDDPPAEWIARSSSRGDKLGYDPRLHTPDAVARFAAACEKAGAGLVAVDCEPDRRHLAGSAAAPLGPITPHPMRFAGEGAGAKIERAREGLRTSDGLLISDPHNLAWLFNIRGSDVSLYPAAARLRLSAAQGTPGHFCRRAKAYGGEPRGYRPAGGDP